MASGSTAFEEGCRITPLSPSARVSVLVGGRSSLEEKRRSGRGLGLGELQ